LRRAMADEIEFVGGIDRARRLIAHSIIVARDKRGRVTGGEGCRA
jgi:hypothetical protein